MLNGICKKIVIFFLISTSVFSYELIDAIKIKNSPITKDSQKQYMEILTKLSNDGNQKAKFMLAEAYEQGVFAQKDLQKALKIYESIETKSKEEFVRISSIYWSLNECDKSFKYANKAYKLGSLDAIKIAGECLIKSDTATKEDFDFYINEFRKLDGDNSETIDLLIEKRGMLILSAKDAISSKSFKNGTILSQKETIFEILTSIKELDKSFRALGYKRTKSLIEFDKSFVFRVVLERVSNRNDINLAKSATLGNVAKSYIIEYLIGLNSFDAELQERLKQKVDLVEFSFALDSFKPTVVIKDLQ